MTIDAGESSAGSGDSGERKRDSREIQEAIDLSPEILLGTHRFVNDYSCDCGNSSSRIVSDALAQENAKALLLLPPPPSTVVRQPSPPASPSVSTVKIPDSKLQKQNPSFFKIFLGDFTSVLHLPPLFGKIFGEKLSAMPSVVAEMSGKSWPLKLEKSNNNKHCLFTEGWSDFVTENQIETGDLAVFWLMDNYSTFQVQLYNRTCCDKQLSSLGYFPGFPEHDKETEVVGVNITSEQPETSPKSKKKNVCPAEIIPDSIAGRLRARRCRRSDTIEISSSDGTQMVQQTSSDISDVRSIEGNVEPETSPKSKRKQVGAEPVPDSIAGRLRQRRARNN